MFALGYMAEILQTVCLKLNKTNCTFISFGVCQLNDPKFPNNYVSTLSILYKE